MTSEQQPAAAKKRFPTPLQAVVLTLAGFAMTFFGCLGAIASWDTSEVLVGIALVATFVGVVALGTGLISVLFLFVKGVMASIITSPNGSFHWMGKSNAVAFARSSFLMSGVASPMNSTWRPSMRGSIIDSQ